MLAGTENRTLERARRGDPDAWLRLVELYKRLVYSVPMRLGLSAEDSSDVFQNTFIALHKNLDRIENSEALPKWLSTVATRDSYRLLRAQQARYTTSLDSLEQVLAAEDLEVDHRALQAVQADKVKSALEQMPTKCKNLLTALYLEDLSYEEIVKQGQMPMGAIGPTRIRCLEKLRKLLPEGLL